MFSFLNYETSLVAFLDLCVFRSILHLRQKKPGHGTLLFADLSRVNLRCAKSDGHRQIALQYSMPLHLSCVRGVLDGIRFAQQRLRIAQKTLHEHFFCRYTQEILHSAVF